MEREPSSKPRRRRAVRWPARMLVALTVLAAVFLAAFIWAYRYRNDEFLAQFIMRQNNAKLRGRLELGRVHWGLRALVDLAMGTPTPASIDRFAVYDPRGREVIFVPRSRGKVELWPLITGGHLIVHDIVAEVGRCRVEEQRFGERPEVGLVAAFAPLKPSGKRGSRIELLDVQIGKVDLLLKFPTWSVHLPEVQTGGSFVLTGGPAGVEGVRYDLAPRAPSGKLTILGVEIPLKDLRMQRFAAWPPRPLDLYSRFTVDAGGAKVEMEGFLLNIYNKGPGIDMQLRARQAQALAARLLGPGAAGPGWLTARATGPLVRPTVQGRIGDVSVGTGELRATAIEGNVVLDAPKTRIGATDLKGRLLGGAVVGAAGLNLLTGNWSLRADVTDVSTAAVHKTLEGRLTGRLRLRGTTRPLIGAEVEVAGDLVRTRRDWIPQRLRLGGTAFLNPAIIDLAGFSVEGEGERLIARGSINLLTRNVNMYLGLDASRLGSWLSTRGLPDAVKAARASLHLRGRWPNIRATGPAEVMGVGYAELRVPKLRGDLELANGMLSLRKIRSEAYGGKLGGEVKVHIFDGRLDRPLPRPTVQGNLSADGLDLAALGAGAWASGRLSGGVEVSGPFDAPTGSANLRMPELKLFGVDYVGATARLGLLRDRLTVYRAQLPRAGGGRLELHGDIFFKRTLDLAATATAFPITAIPGIASVSLRLGGQVSGTVRGTGSFDDPRLEGKVALAGLRVRGVNLGSGEFTLTPGSDSVRISGRALGGSVSLDGYLLPRPRRMHLTVDVTRFPLEKLLYEMRVLGDVRASVDGRIRLEADTKVGLSWATVKLTSGEVSLLYLPPGERRQRRIQLTSVGDMTAEYDGNELRVDPARLVTRVEGQRESRAEFSVGGRVSRAGPDLRLKGRVALALLEFFLAQRVKQAQGEATTDVRLGGRFDNLSLDGRIELGDISLRLAGYGREIRVRKGSLRFTPGKIQLDRFEVEVERARMTATGDLRLKQFRPDQANLHLRGDLNMRLVQLVFPEQLSHCSGTAAVDLKVSGPVADPRLTGQLGVKHIELSPRGWGRTITLNKGEVAFSNYLLKTLRPLEGSFDEGSLRVTGEVRLDRWEPVDIYLKIAGVGIPHRQPKVYTAEANLNLTLLGDSSQLSLSGEVDLVDARYIQQFDVVRQLFIRPRVFEEEKPFWKGKPLLANLQLRLEVQSTGQLSVKNDYAALSLSGALTVTGTLAEPRLGGQVRVEDGTFRIPLMRGEYTINRGDVSFNERKSIDSATIDISGETILPADRNGVEYQIRLMLQGPLNNIGIQLSSVPSLEQGQILALLAFGRTTDQLRKQLKTSGEGGSQAAGAADAQVKQLTGEILSNIIEEPLKKVTRLDVARLEVGTESAQLRVCKKLGKYANLCGDYEYGMLGDSRAEGRVEIKISDLLMLVGKLERISTRLEVETVDPQRGRGELKLRLPLR